MTEIKKGIETGWKLENSYAHLPKAFFSKVENHPVTLPKMILLNRPLAEFLGLSIEELESAEGVELLGGNKLPHGSIPIAQAYAGHQFGYFTLLGDGRALLLGEQLNPLGQRFDIQLKGSGRTPYSRQGDGRAALGPMLREYIISEAMHGLGIKTTRSLAVVTTGEMVARETMKKGGILTRVAASHIRVGTFEYIAKCGTGEELRILADYTIQRHFKEVSKGENPYLALLKEVIKGQADLIAKWQLVGFIHGVMNTDNMAICGETIDYGPCAFLDKYDTATVFSSIDTHGRYAYGNQPYIAAWNLTRFAETLLPLLSDKRELAVKLAQDAVLNFMELYHQNWLEGMRKKLGIFNQEEEDEVLIDQLLVMMQKHQADYTNTFLGLTFDLKLESALFATEEFLAWQKRWKERLGRQQEAKNASFELMKHSNPAPVPRNHRVEEAIKAAENEDYSVIQRLLEVLSEPYAHSQEQGDYSLLPEASDSPYKTYCGT